MKCITHIFISTDFPVRLPHTTLFITDSLPSTMTNHTLLLQQETDHC